MHLAFVWRIWGGRSVVVMLRSCGGSGVDIASDRLTTTRVARAHCCLQGARARLPSGAKPLPCRCRWSPRRASEFCRTGAIISPALAADLAQLLVAVIAVGHLPTGATSLPTSPSSHAPRNACRQSPSSSSASPGCPLVVVPRAAFNIIKLGHASARRAMGPCRAFAFAIGGAPTRGVPQEGTGCRPLISQRRRGSRACLRPHRPSKATRRPTCM